MSPVGVRETGTVVRSCAQLSCEQKDGYGDF